MLKQGLDPSLERKRARAAAKVSAGNSFEVVAEEFVVKRQKEGLSDATTAKARWLLS